MDRRERELRKLIKAEGCKVLELTQTKHYKVRVQLPDGGETLLVAAVSTGDQRSAANMRSFLRGVIASRRTVGSVV